MEGGGVCFFFKNFIVSNVYFLVNKDVYILIWDNKLD